MAKKQDKKIMIPDMIGVEELTHIAFKIKYTERPNPIAIQEERGRLNFTSVKNLTKRTDLIPSARNIVFAVYQHNGSLNAVKDKIRTLLQEPNIISVRLAPEQFSELHQKKLFNSRRKVKPKVVGKDKIIGRGTRATLDTKRNPRIEKSRDRIVPGGMENRGLECPGYCSGDGTGPTLSMCGYNPDGSFNNWIYCSGFSTRDRCNDCGTAEDHPNYYGAPGCSWTDQSECAMTGCLDYCADNYTLFSHGECVGCDCEYTAYDCEAGCVEYINNNGEDDAKCNPAPGFLGPPDDTPGSGPVGGDPGPGPNDTYGCWQADACNYDPDTDYQSDAMCVYSQTYNCYQDFDGDGYYENTQQIQSCSANCSYWLGADWVNESDILGPEVYGCTNPNACNYNYQATQGDASCILPHGVSTCYGDMDGDGDYETPITNINLQCYNTLTGAESDAPGGPNNWIAAECENYTYCRDFDGDGNFDDCSDVMQSVQTTSGGCMGLDACNYDIFADEDDGSCYYCYQNDCENYPSDSFYCDGAMKFGANEALFNVTHQNELINCPENGMILDHLLHSVTSYGPDSVGVCWKDAIREFGQGPYAPSTYIGQMEWAGAGEGCNDFQYHPDIDMDRVIIHDNIGCESADVYPGHSLACASIMMANSHNDYGMVGACPGCGLYFFPIHSNWYGIPEGLSYEEILEAAVENGIKIINASLGGTYTGAYYDYYGMQCWAHDPDMQAAINDAYNAGTILIVSAGNTGVDHDWHPQESLPGLPQSNEAYSNCTVAGCGCHPDDPGKGPSHSFCDYDNVLCVAESTGYWDFDSSCEYSSETTAPVGSCNWIDISAPQATPMALKPSPNTMSGWKNVDGDTGASVAYNTGYFGDQFGTSFSAPLVTGIAGLLLSHNPNLTGPQIKEILTSTNNLPSYQYGESCISAWPKTVEVIEENSYPGYDQMRAWGNGGKLGWLNETWNSGLPNANYAGDFRWLNAGYFDCKGGIYNDTTHPTAPSGNSGTFDTSPYGTYWYENPTPQQCVDSCPGSQTCCFETIGGLAGLRPRPGTINAKAALQYQKEHYPYLATSRGTPPPASPLDKAQIIDEMRKQGDIVHYRKTSEEQELKED